MGRAPHPWDRFYHQQAAPWRGERAVDDWLPLLGEGPVLELGVGNGKTLRPLQHRGVDVVPLDVSWNAMARLGDGVVADAAHLPFRDGSFTAVLDLHCTGHLLEAGRRQAAQEKRRVLAPGGHLIVERLHPEDLRAQKGEVPEPGTRRLQDGRTTHFGSVDDVIAEHEGWQAVSHQDIRRETRHRGVDVVRRHVRVVLR